MVELNMPPEEQPKKLIFGDQEKQTADIKITNSPQKRWKTFAVIAGIVAVLAIVSVAANWQYFSSGTFRGFALIEDVKTDNKTKVGNKEVATKPGSDEKIIQVPWWDCDAGFSPNLALPGNPGKCQEVGTYDSAHGVDYGMAMQREIFWECPKGFSQTKTPGECKENINGSLGPNQLGVINDSQNNSVADIGQGAANLGKDKLGSVGKVADKIAENAANGGCPSGTKPMMLATGKTKCVAVEKEPTAAEDPNSGGTGVPKCPAGQIPKETTTKGKYECVEYNKFGTIEVTMPDEIPVVTATTKKPDDTGVPKCPAGQIPKETTTKGKYECVEYNKFGTIEVTMPDEIPVVTATTKKPDGTTSTSCTSLATKIVSYKDALLQENTQGKSQVEVEVIEYLFTEAVQSALENKCTVNEEYVDAEKCTDKEIFDKKTKACKSAPGYTKVGNNSDEYDCTELDSAVAAIDLKLLDSKLSTAEKTSLSSLKLGLTNGKEYCKNQNNGGTSGGTSGGGGSSGGGGGGTAGGSKSSSSKSFAIKNLQVKPQSFNPFKEKATVYFFITADAYVSLQVWDGTTVIQTIKEVQMNAGDRSITWDGKKSAGGFAPEKQYKLKVIAKKASNKANKVEDDVDVSIKYFDESVDLAKDPTFEDVTSGDSGTITFNTGAGTGSGNGSGSTSSIHSSASPLAQNLYAQGQGKTVTSKTGPETLAYLFLLMFAVGSPFIYKNRKRRS